MCVTFTGVQEAVVALWWISATISLGEQRDGGASFVSCRSDQSIRTWMARQGLPLVVVGRFGWTWFVFVASLRQRRLCLWCQAERSTRSPAVRNARSQKWLSLKQVTLNSLKAFSWTVNLRSCDDIDTATGRQSRQSCQTWQKFQN